MNHETHVLYSEIINLLYQTHVIRYINIIALLNIIAYQYKQMRYYGTPK